MPKQEQRVVLVTGASSGIGLASVMLLAQRGFRVYGASRSPCAAPGVATLPMDVTDDAAVKEAVAKILAQEGRIDVVVNNAGMGIAAPLEATSTAEAKQQFAVNFFGALNVCRAVLPAMRAQRSGCIVNVGSIAGLIALPYQSMYSATKFALEGMSEALRMEVRPFGIRVALVQPGDHKTAFTSNRRVGGLPATAEVYRASFAAALSKAAHDEQNGPGPEQVARVIHHIVNQRNPRLRYTVGPLPQRGAVWLKRLGPYRLMEFALRMHYGINR